MFYAYLRFGSVTRCGLLQSLTLSVEQSIALATRPYPAQIMFLDCDFGDGGSAFVDALERRESSFGLSPLDADNLKRLLQVDAIEKLIFSLLDDDVALLPFSAKAERLDYDFPCRL